MKYTEHFRINSHDEDENGIVRASAVMRYLQETANLQLHTFGPSNEELRKNGQAFLLSRVSTELTEPLHAYEEITVQTWSCFSRGYSFFRCHRILRGDKTVARAQTVWALIDIKSRKLVRADTYRPNFEPDPIFIPSIEDHIIVPHTEKMKELGSHRVTYLETDINHHMNNTVYPDMLADFLPMKEKRIAAYTVNFMNEAPLHETVRIYATESQDNTFLLRSVREDGKTNVEAKIVTVPIQ